MIDFSAVESEIMGLLTGAYSFKSTMTGRIRETVPNSSMPSCDVAVGESRATSYAGYEEFRTPVTIVLRVGNTKRTTAEATLKVIIEALRTALTDITGTNFNVLREIEARATDDESGEGSSIRTGIVTLTAIS